MIVVGFIALVLGAMLVAAGVRGRRIGVEPHCRRCGYSLRGTPDASRCPECGRDLAERRAIEIGRRKRRALPVAAGVALLLVGAACASSAGRRLAAQAFTIENAPAWWLRRSIARADAADADRAADVLMTRLDRGELSAGDRLLGALVDRQANTALAWTPTLADLARRADVAGLFPNSPALSRLLAGSLTVVGDPLGPDEGITRDGLIALPGVREVPGRGFPREAIDVDFGAARCAFVERPTLVSRQPRPSVSSGVWTRSGGMHGTGDGRWRLTSLADPLHAALLGPGSRRVAIEMTYTLRLSRNQSVRALDEAAGAALPMATGTLAFEADAKVAAPVAPRESDVDGAAFFAGLRLRPNDLETGRHVTFDGRTPCFELYSPASTSPVAAAVSLRDAKGRVWPMQPFVRAAENDGPQMHLIFGTMDAADWATFDAERVDVIVESSAAVEQYMRVRGPCLTGRRVWTDVPVLRRAEP